MSRVVSGESSWDRRLERCCELGAKECETGLAVSARTWEETVLLANIKSKKCQMGVLPAMRDISLSLNVHVETRINARWNAICKEDKDGKRMMKNRIPENGKMERF